MCLFLVWLFVMLQLDHRLKLDKDAIKASNLCDRFEKADLQRIGAWVYEGYLRDKGSRAKWERRTEAAMDLALQIQKDKNFPWPNCSNVAFPLVTIATLQFHSRAYSQTVDGSELVKARVIGEDPNGEKQARSERISTHMSYQLLEEDKAWEEQQDRLLINLPVVGTVFKKSYRDVSKGRNVSEMVLARDLVLNYWAKSVEECPRKTHCFPLYRNDIHEKAMRGTFCNVLKEAWYTQAAPPVPRTDQQQMNKDNRQGLTPPMPDRTTFFNGLEQHVLLDLDGDGYAEPYIITIEESSQCVLRIVTGFDREEDIERVQEGANKGKIIKISGLQYFTKYSFVPSPDGGIYDIGFGVLLGPLNETVNTNINQLVDAGTMATTAGGFLGRGAKIRGGTYTFAPFEWNRVDSTGDDLSKSIFPLPVRDPSSVLFQLLVLLINYTNRIAGSTDVLVGENPGQNQPAETTRTVVDQGLKIYGAIFKRVWRCMKEEFKKLYILNGIYMPLTSRYGANQLALKDDYLGDPETVIPAADPNIVSDQMQFNQAKAVKEAAMMTPGYDRDAVEMLYLKALHVPNARQIFPGTKGQPPAKSEKLQIAELEMQLERERMQREDIHFAAELMEQQKLNNAEINKLQAEAVKALADIEGDAKDRQISQVNAMIGLLKQRNEMIDTRLERIFRVIELDKQKGTDGKERNSPEGRRLLSVVARSGDPSGASAPAAPLATGAG